MTGVTATYFKTAAEFRRWLQKHHASAGELWVGFYKKATGRPTITWSEAVDEALCFGWIDGIRRRVDEERYANRFTPRRAGSVWSDVNTRRAEALIAAGRMAAPGRKAFDARDRAKTAAQTAVRREGALTAALLRQFKANRAAWTFFQAQPPGYRRMMQFFVMSAKQEATRQRRLELLLQECAAGRRIEPMGPRPRLR